MKRYIRNNIYDSNFHLDIVVDIEYFDDTSRIAASEYRGFYVPDGPVISGLPDAVLGSQALQDYADFIESVQDLMTDFYHLEIYYKNKSKDNSFYFGSLVKDREGNIIADFDFTLRVSNHDSHRSEQSQQHKKERKAKLKELTQGKDTQPITKSIIVNSEKCKDYMDAYLKVDAVISRAVEVMSRKSR